MNLLAAPLLLAALAPQEGEPAMVWHDARELLLEGQAWTGESDPPAAKRSR